MIKQEISVDFKALEPLAKAPSKKYVKKLIQDCFYLKNYTAKFDESYKTTIIQGLGSDLGLEEKQTHKVILISPSPHLQYIIAVDSRNDKPPETLLTKKFQKSRSCVPRRLQ